MAFCILLASEQGRTAKYVLAFDFFNEIRKSFNDYRTDKVISGYEHYDYLVIDEIEDSGTPEFLSIFINQ